AHGLNQASLVVIVEVLLEGDAILAGTRILEPSGEPSFDQAALEVVREADLPAPPSGLMSDDQRLHLRWTFARDRRQAGVAGAAIEIVRRSAVEAVPGLIERGSLAEAADRIANEAAAPTADAAVLTDL